MKMYMATMTLAVLALAGCGSDSAEAPISVSVNSSDQFGGVVHGVGGTRATTFTRKRLVVQALQDVTISGVELNRGNCEIYDDELRQFPAKLSYGETLEVSASGCDLIEASVKANSETWSFNFSG